MLSLPAQTATELKQELLQLQSRYEQHKAQQYAFSMARGKPCSEQLDLSAGLTTVLDPGDYLSEDGIDCRNYGVLEGLPEARRLFAELLDTTPDNVMVMGNSSLHVMFDQVCAAMLVSLPGGDRSWSHVDRPAFLCPTPGYDRHFAITERLGIENIPVRMTPEGPDMDQVEELVRSDARIKGMWCVPVYSNPDGITYSEETCRRLAAMPAAAPDFRLFWDNAYSVHHLYPDEPASVPDMIGLCAKEGNPDRAYVFASTSKVTFAGGGIACLASSPANLAHKKDLMKYQTISPDKLNQLRHVRFLPDAAQVAEHMTRHAAILRPKFETVLRVLDEELTGTDIAHWSHPKGGYFISLFLMPGTAAETIRMAGACGVEFTPAGAAYPGGVDPEDSNVRIAPSFPAEHELEVAAEVLAICAKIAAIQKLLSA